MDRERSEWRPQRRPGHGHARSRLATVRGCGVLHARLPAVHTCEAWAVQLVETAGVKTHPGYFFEFAMPAVLVVSLLTPVDVFQHGMGLLLEHVLRSA